MDSAHSFHSVHNSQKACKNSIPLIVWLNKHVIRVLYTWQCWDNVSSDLYSLVLLWYLLSGNLLKCCKSFSTIIYHTQRNFGFFILRIWRVFPRYILCLMDWMICVFELFMRSTCIVFLYQKFSSSSIFNFCSNIEMVWEKEHARA